MNHESPDSVWLSRLTADALDSLDMGDISKVNSPERMAWVVYVLRHMPDSAKIFPRGKWATIQVIEEQLIACAHYAAQELIDTASSVVRK